MGDTCARSVQCRAAKGRFSALAHSGRRRRSLIALNLSRIVTSAVGAVPATRAAEKVIEDNVVDAAVLGIRLENGDTIEFAKELHAAISRSCFIAGFSPPPIVLAKPYAPERLIAALREL